MSIIIDPTAKDPLDESSMEVPLILEPGQQLPPSKGKMRMLVKNAPYRQVQDITEPIPEEWEGQPVSVESALVVAGEFITAMLRKALSDARNSAITVEDLRVTAMRQDQPDGSKGPLVFVLNGLGLEIPTAGGKSRVVEVEPELGPVLAEEKIRAASAELKEADEGE